jgi:peptidoglycan/LPS O-acetylase OafA/YrhL
VAFYALVFGLIAIGRFSWIKLLAVVIGLQSTIFWVTYAIAANNPESALFQFLRHLQDSRIMELVLLHHGCFFALGIFLWAQLAKQASRANIWWCLLFTATGCLQIYAVTLSFYYKFDIIQPIVTPIVLWLLSLIAIVLAVVCNERVHQAPAWLIASLRKMGLMTYPLYLLHQTAGLAFMGMLVKSGVNAYAALFSTIALVFAAAWFVCTFCEPPLQNLTREILLKLKGNPKPAVLADIG